MPRQPEEGPVRRRPPAQEGRRPERAGREEGHQDLVAAAPRSSPTWSATPSPSTTGASTCPCTSPSRWSATSSASSRPPAPSGSTPARRRTREGGASDGRSGPRPTSVPAPAPRSRYVRMSAYKAREVLDLIRGKHVAQADEILQFAERDVAIVDPQVPRLGRGQRREQRQPATPTSCTCRPASPTRARRSSAGAPVPAAAPRASASAPATSRSS